LVTGSGSLSDGASGAPGVPQLAMSMVQATAKAAETRKTNRYTDLVVVSVTLLAV
jgi:hypothetical protein